jgi:hypothetical protein
MNPPYETSTVESERGGISVLWSRCGVSGSAKDPDCSVCAKARTIVVSAVGSALPAIQATELLGIRLRTARAMMPRPFPIMNVCPSRSKPVPRTQTTYPY